MFGMKNSTALRANDGVRGMVLDRRHPLPHDPRAVAVQILFDESVILLGREVAISGISLDELEGIEARVHAADHVEVEPPMPFQSVPDAALAAGNDDIIDAVPLELPDQRNGREAEADDQHLRRYDLVVGFSATARSGRVLCRVHGSTPRALHLLRLDARRPTRSAAVP
jgi:hypothetical protein